MTVTVHQLFHGYSRGHRRLAGTVELLPADVDAVDQLSDLTGMLPPGEIIDSYYTAYPVPSGKWYAFARTWLDEEAPRAGCVMTQTLLLSREDEYSNPDLSPLINHFAENVTECYSLIKRTLEPISISNFGSSEYQPDLVSSAKVTDRKLYVSALIRWFFATRTRPLVQFGSALNLGDILGFRRLLWDEVRFRFSFCTLALQPISRPDAEFDLLIAPTIAESRFYQRGTTIAPAAQVGQSEGWIRVYEQALFQKNQSELMDLYRLGRELACLGPDPTVFPLLADLARMSHRTSHEDLVEALDLIKQLAPAAEQGLKSKKEFMSWAFEAISSLNTETHSQFRLLTNILMACQSNELGAAFAQCRDKAKEAVTRVFSKDIEVSLNVISEMKPDKLPQIEVEGIAEALIAAARNHTVSFSGISHEWIAALLSSSDVFVEALQASLSPSDFERILAKSVVVVPPKLRTRLLLSVQTFAVLRREFDLLSFAYELSDSEIANQLFYDLPEVQDSPIWRAAEAFTKFHSTEARQLSRKNLLEQRPGRRWRYLYVLSLPLEVAGLTEVLELVSKDTNAADLLQMYLQRFGTQRIDGSIRNHLAKHCELISDLISKACLSPSPALLDSLDRLIADVPEIDIAFHPEMIDSLEGKNISFAGELIRRSFSHAIRSYLERKMPQAKLEGWIRSSYALAWLSDQSPWQMQGLLRTSVSPTSATRLMKLLLLMPDLFWKRFSNVIFDVIREHGDRASDREFVALCQPWLEVLKKMDSFDDKFIVLKLRFYALFKAVGVPHLPVSGFVVDSFSPVHDYLCLDKEDREMEPVLSYIPWPTWDKAKYVRKRLVAAFLDSEWPKVDLVKACASPGLLRKILQRLKKSSKGQTVIQDLCRLVSNTSGEFEQWRRLAVLDVAGGRGDSEEWL